MQEGLSFGAWLRQRRTALGLTQDGLAERVGCSSEMVRKLEAGAARPSRPMAEALIAGLDLPLAEQPALVQWARAGGPPPVLTPVPTAPRRPAPRRNPFSRPSPPASSPSYSPILRAARPTGSTTPPP
jgi:transcriptional regulator with XRE-family HTH domain